MMARLPSLTLIRFWAALLLAVIGAQATAPAAPSLEKTHGSAFSATTYEVALDVKRSERANRQAVAPQPLLAVSLAEAIPLAAFPARAHGYSVRPDSTGPPLANPLSWQPAPRAPPYT